jgi:GAF domain-containing protein
MQKPGKSDPYVTIGDALARPGQPEPTYATFERLTGDVFGHKLLTILAWHGSDEVERVHTSRPAEYPLLGRKRMGPTAWGEIVLKEGRPWLGTSAQDIRWAFPDHELILSLGCDSCLNAPIRFDGRVLGVVSLLDGPARYNERDLVALQPLAQFLAPTFLR